MHNITVRRVFVTATHELAIKDHYRQHLSFVFALYFYKLMKNYFGKLISLFLSLLAKSAFSICSAPNQALLMRLYCCRYLRNLYTWVACK